jgi:hypothetical protein
MDAKRSLSQLETKRLEVCPRYVCSEGTGLAAPSDNPASWAYDLLNDEVVFGRDRSETSKACHQEALSRTVGGSSMLVTYFGCFPHFRQSGETGFFTGSEALPPVDAAT